MSQKETRKFEILCLAKEGRITVREAAGLLGLCERQVKRLKKGVKEFGAAAIAHGNRGRKPPHSIPDSLRAYVLEIAESASFAGVNFSHFKDLLEEREHIVLSVSSVARILKNGGIASSRKHRVKKRYKSRPRKSQAGLLVQIDASPHPWLEDRGPAMTLVGIIDDATGAVLGATFRAAEDMNGYFMVLKQTISRYGIPLSIYSDRHTIFVSPASERVTIEDELAGRTKRLTQFGRALEELGIAHLKALTPQAKGRIERLWQTFQDRLVIEMRLKGITSLEEANAFLKEFVEKHNRRFSVKPEDDRSAFRPSPGEKALRQILCRQDIRKASSGSTISYANTLYHLIDAGGQVIGLKPKSAVTVFNLLDGTLAASYRDTLYRLKKFEMPEKEQTREAPPRRAKIAATGVTKPADDHPWRKFVINKKASIRYREKALEKQAAKTVT